MRERMIASGHIRPATTTTERTVRETLIGSGLVRPAPDGMSMPQIMREFMWRCTRNHMGREHRMDVKHRKSYWDSERLGEYRRAKNEA